jgi:hypothetical protein
MPAAGSGSSGSASAAAATGKQQQQQQAQRRNDGKEDDGQQKKRRDVGPKDKRRMMVWPVMFAQYFGLVSCHPADGLRAALGPPGQWTRFSRIRIHFETCVWWCTLSLFTAQGLMRPEMPGLLLELFDGSMENVALYQGATDAVGALVAFALVPLIGDFSDEKGRKPALLISAICAAAPVFVLALYDHLLGVWPTIILYAAVALVSKLNSYSVALSYVADCSSIAQRSVSGSAVTHCFRCAVVLASAHIFRCCVVYPFAVLLCLVR